MTTSVRFIHGSMQKELQCEVDGAWFSPKENRVVVQTKPFRDRSVKDEYFLPKRVLNKVFRVKVDWAKARTDPGYRDWVDLMLDRALKGKRLPYKKLPSVMNPNVPTEPKRYQTFKERRDKERGFVKLKVKFQLTATTHNQMRVYTMFKQYMEDMEIAVRSQKVKPFRGILSFEHEQMNRKVINATFAIDETLLKESWGLKVREDVKEDIGHYVQKFKLIRQIFGFGEVT